MRAIDCVQGSPDWKAARCGKITASRICDVMARIKKGEAKDRENYRNELVAERLTGVSDDGAFQTRWLREGKENEPVARTAYELATGNFLDQYGFVLHPTLDFSGASPDGIYGTTGGVQLKCPKSTTHIRWMEDGRVPAEHVDQMMWEMRCCELEWLDFASFDPRMKDEGMRLFVPPRLVRDEKRIAEIESEVIRFEGKIQEHVRFLGGLRRQDSEATDDGVWQPGIVQSLHRSIDAR